MAISWLTLVSFHIGIVPLAITMMMSVMAVLWLLLILVLVRFVALVIVFGFVRIGFRFVLFFRRIFGCRRFLLALRFRIFGVFFVMHVRNGKGCRQDRENTIA